MDIQATFNRQHPFMASIKERYSLSRLGSKKQTVHVVLNIEGSNLKYEAGDSIAVFPVNDAFLVERTLKALDASGEEVVLDKKGVSYSFREFLTSHANLKGITRKTVLRLLPIFPRRLELLLICFFKREIKRL